MTEPTSQGWSRRTLRNLATINYGKSPKAILAVDGPYPVVGTGGAERYGDGFLYDGESIILGRKGTIDRVHFVTGRFWPIDTAYYLSDFEGIQPRWLYYFLQNIDLRQLNEATGVPSLSRDSLYNIDVGTPTKPEQTKIAEILSTVDQAIEQTEALIAKQERIKTGLMQDLLTRGIDESGNLRSEETHEFKDSAIGRIPVEWKVLSIDSISDFVTSGARGWAKYYSDEGAVFFRIGNLTRDHINLRFDDIVFVRPSTSAEGLRTSVRPNDILISITADLGIIGVIPTDFQGGYVNQHIALIRIPGFEVNQRFIGWFLQSRAGQIQFEKHNESGAKAGLNLPTIRRLLIAAPPPSEQGRIAQVLDEISNMVSHLQGESRKQRHLKAALMQDLLTGAVSVASLLTEAEVDA